jgi:hypothetical protein
VSGLKEVRSAIFTAIQADATIMARTGNAGLKDRLIKGSPLSKTVSALTSEGGTSFASGGKDEVTVTIHVWAYSRDLVDDTTADLMRLFHPTPPYTFKSLAVAGANAKIRRDNLTDVPDPGSELWHQAVRFRVLLALAA